MVAHMGNPTIGRLRQKDSMLEANLNCMHRKTIFQN